jgi:hypothetical protein
MTKNKNKNKKQKTNKIKALETLSYMPNITLSEEVTKARFKPRSDFKTPLTVLPNLCQKRDVKKVNGQRQAGVSWP